MRRICIFVLFSVFCLKGFSQLEDTISNHVIIAFDLFTGSYSSILINNTGKQVSRKIEKSLEGIIKPHDRITISNFGIGRNNIDINDLSKPIIVDGKEFAWREFSTYQNLWGNLNWRNIVTQRQQHISGEPFSLLTGSKSFTIKSVFRDKSDCLCNRTYLVMITDDHYNGNNDYKEEFKHLTNINSYHPNGTNPYLKLNEFEKICIDVADHYDIKQITERVIDRELKVNVYEVIPKKVIPIQSITDIPSKLPIVKVRGGYKIKVDMNSLTPAYSVIKVRLNMERSGGQKTSETPDVDFFIARSSLREGDLITLRTWVKCNDSVYNSTVLNPYDERYSRILNITQTVTLSDDSKIMGIFPLIDAMWWFFPNDIQAAVMVWDIIFILIFILIICITAFRIFRSMTRYIPDNKDITLSKI